MEIRYKITDDDFFKLLKVKFPYTLAGCYGAQVHKNSIFREHIDVLELLWEIQKNSGYREVGWSTNLPIWMANTTHLFDQLFQTKNQNIGIWGIREAIAYRCFNELIALARNILLVDNVYNWEILRFRSGAGVDLHNLVNLIKKIDTGNFTINGYNAPTQIDSLNTWTQNEKYQDVFSVYKMYGSIFTTCLNFHFPNNNFLNFDMFAQQRLNDIDLIRKNIIERDPALVKAFYKLEEDGVGGLKFSCILLYAGAAKKSKQNLIRHITLKLKVMIIDYPIVLQDWGVVIDQLAHQKVVGYINDEESLERFFYWTVSPYLQYDQFFKLRKQTNFNSTPKWVDVCC